MSKEELTSTSSIKNSSAQTVFCVVIGEVVVEVVVFVVVIPLPIFVVLPLYQLYFVFLVGYFVLDHHCY